MQLEQIKISDLRPHPKNYNKHPEHQIIELAKSFKRFKQFKNIVIDEKNTILAGHGLVEVLQRLGIKTVDAERMVGLSEDDKVALLAADNLTASLAEPDTNLLAELLSGLECPADVPGVTDALLAELGIDISGGESGEGLTDADEIPEQVESICKTGDIWQLGNHRLLCGDCTDTGNVERLVNKLDISFTDIDPPYEMEYEKQSFVGKMAKGCSVFWGMSFELFQVFQEMNIIPDLDMVWRFYFGRMYSKSRPFCHHRNLWIYNIGDSYNSDYRNKNGAPGSTFFESSYTSELHKHQKPVDLYVYLLELYTKKSNVCLSFFGGSGSFLIACEKTNRKCRMMEIDEHYCDVIITRWQNHTGQKAVKI